MPETPLYVYMERIAGVDTSQYIRRIRPQKATQGVTETPPRIEAVGPT
jgi:hypothetical protein